MADPVSGIKVTAFRKQSDGTFVNAGSSTTSSPGGEYFIGDLAEGQYALKFQDESNGIYQTVYSGGKQSLDEATTYYVDGAGGHQTVNITMSSASYIDGVVTGV